MGGVIFHGGSPILPALFALAERHPTSGRQLLLAYVVGFETGVRVGQSAPGHHRAGWHLTGTLGTLAAGVAAGKLLELDARQLTYALGIAATQAAGLQQNRGTMCKSLHAGKAASNGVLAALLAEQGFDSSAEIVEGARGFSRVFSDVAAPERLVEQLGQSWEIARNGHKPYACGVVLHPAIDAAIRIRNGVAVEPATIERVEARVHPLVLLITGVAEPTSGLQSKFSIFHSIAVALLDGAAGINQFGDRRAAAREVVELRERVRVEADPTLATDQAEVSLVVGGQRHSVFVEHASGTAESPMSDGDLEAKFRANAEPVIGSERSARVRALVGRLESLADVRELIEACA
jgi:2-methylcitrate dehydratase PrpD